MQLRMDCKYGYIDNLSSPNYYQDSDKRPDINYVTQ